MLYGLVVGIHVVACLVLILVILLQAGRGGGLSEAFGGGSSQTIFGAKANVFLTRATTAAAIMFIITCLSLGIMTSRRGRSLIDRFDPTVVQPERIPGSQDPTQYEGEIDLDEAKKDLPKTEPLEFPE